MLLCAINVKLVFLSFIRKAILPIENEICPHDSDEAFEEGQTEVVITSMYDVQKNIFRRASVQDIQSKNPKSGEKGCQHLQAETLLFW